MSPMAVAVNSASLLNTLVEARVAESESTLVVDGRRLLGDGSGGLAELSIEVRCVFFLLFTQSTDTA